MSIARVVVPIAAAQSFDYWVPDGLDVVLGSVVRVTLGARSTVGVVVARPSSTDVPPDRLRPLLEVIRGLPPVPADILALASFAADYYQQPLGGMLAISLPSARSGAARREPPDPGSRRVRLTEAGRSVLTAPGRLGELQRRLAVALDEAQRQGRAPSIAELRACFDSDDARRLGGSLSRWAKRGWVAFVETSPARDRGDAGPIVFVGTLNAEQRAAVDCVCRTLGRFAVLLLRGITGSGKTEVYLAAAREAIAGGGQVLLLVPEINLTPQLAARVGSALPGARLALLHSALGGGDRGRAWHAAAKGSADIVLGTRLAVFAPMPRLALIVVDEEHDSSFRQQDGVRYHARDLAIVRARERAVPVVLGSATPSLESYRAAEQGRYREIVLAQRASPGARAPVVRLVPNRAEPDAAFASAVGDAIALRLTRGEQSMVFVNRRGFAPSLLCHACGWASSCPRCSARLVLHRSARQLRCHHCGHVRAVTVACPECGNQDLFPVGAGTQRLEQQLAACFPGARIARVDRDSTARRGAFPAVMTQVLAGEVDILVGTQMLAKGHDFPALTLVAVLGADNALYSADFRATERLFALLMQVSGRAGRGARAGEVIVQTDFPDHPLYCALVAQDFPAFARSLLAERGEAGLPPFVHLAMLAAEARGREDVDAFLAAAEMEAQALIASLGVGCEVHSPGVPVLARRAGYERGQLLVQSARRRALHALLRGWRPALEALAARRIRWQLEVDPLELG